MAEYFLRPSVKTARGYFKGDVKWIEKKPSRILLCKCGKKYIKTRLRQKTCVPCIHGYKVPQKPIYR